MNTTIELPTSWKEWEITEMIGAGAYGTVYKAEKRVEGEEPQLAAIKIIKIPAGDAEMAALASEYPSIDARIEYCDNLVQGMLSEIHAMEVLKDNPHCVTLEDYYVDHEEGSLTWTIYIRMDLLQPLSEYMVVHELDEKELIKLGTDICRALETCQEHKILHRDIKPENIMIDRSGNFKLGDFGVAKDIGALAGSLSVRGTFTYMAPEVYHGNDYDILADEYSLGIVLYRLFNNNRDPFTDPDTPVVYFKDRETALKRRMRGEKLPAPINAPEELAQVIAKACAYNPDDRYQTIKEFREALEGCVPPEPEPEPEIIDVYVKDDYPAKSEDPEKNEVAQKPEEPVKEKGKKTRHRRRWWIPVVAVAAVLAVATVLILMNRGGTNVGNIVENIVGNDTENRFLWGKHEYYAISRDFELGMRYMNLDTEEGVYNLSAVPYAFHAGPYNGRDDRIILLFKDQFDEEYVICGEYKFKDRILTISPTKATDIEQFYPNQKILSLKHNLQFSVYYGPSSYDKNGIHNLKNVGMACEARYQCETKKDNGHFLLEGKLSGNEAYEDIEGIAIDCDLETYEGNATIYFTDGGETVDAKVEYISDYTYYIHITYKNVKRPYNGQIKEFKESGSLATKLINCYPYGFIIYDDDHDEHYFYQSY